MENGSSATRACCRLWPHRLEGEGHFLAILRKASGDAKPRLSPAPTLGKLPSEYLSFLSEALTVPLTDRIARYGDRLWRLPEEMPALDSLKVLRTGIELGTLKKGRFEPAHALALALQRQDFRFSLDFPADAPEIKAYLRGETFPAEQPNGWAAVCVDHFPLGWGKAAGGILKNHYPKGLRHT